MKAYVSVNITKGWDTWNEMAEDLNSEMVSVAGICFQLINLQEKNQSVCFARIGDFTWRVSDSEELVEVTWRSSDL